MRGSASLQSTVTCVTIWKSIGRSKHRRLFFLKKKKKNHHTHTPHFLCACIELCQRQGDSQVSHIRHDTCYASSRTKPTRYTERKYCNIYIVGMPILCVYTRWRGAPNWETVYAENGLESQANVHCYDFRTSSTFNIIYKFACVCWRLAIGFFFRFELCSTTIRIEINSFNAKSYIV